MATTSTRLPSCASPHPELTSTTADCSSRFSQQKPLYDGVRGHSLNKGANLQAVHPLITVNPVTGWKGLFVNQVFTKRYVRIHLHDLALGARPGCARFDDRADARALTPAGSSS